jgi:branched-subunit amino acid aminotransferase/4-amino-4-deoxychorismate lyase
MGIKECLMLENPAFLYGESCFVTMRIYSGKVLYKNQQLIRLAKFIEEYYLARTLTDIEKENIQKDIESNIDQDNGVMRVSAYTDPRDQLLQDTVSFEEIRFSYTWRTEPVEKKLSLMTAPSPFTFDYPPIKMGSYMPHFYYKKQAQRQGFDDVIFCVNEKVVECSTSNLFFVKEDRLFTSDQVFYPGLIRENIFSLLDIEIKEIDRSVLSEFDYAFTTNSVSIINAVEKIDNIKYNINHKFINKFKEQLIHRGLDDK